MGNNIIFDSLTCIQLHKSVNSFFLTPITKQVISTSTNHYHRNWRYVSFAFAKLVYRCIGDHVNMLKHGI